jgi:peroxiredoxin
MTETKAESTFPQFKSTPTTKRTILGPMYDDSGDEDESEYSFVNPYGDKRCHVKSRTIFDRLATNLNDVKLFGNAVRLHAEHKVMKLIEEDYESDSSNERISKSKTVNFMFDKATGCATSIRTLAEDVGDVADMNLCNGNGAFATGASSSEQQQRQNKVPSPIKVIRKKKESEVERWEGVLKDDLTVTSDEYYSDEDSFSGSESSWSSQYSISSSESDRRSMSKAELRRKKNKFIQRRALERVAAGSDSDDSSFYEYRGGADLHKKANTMLPQKNVLHKHEMRPQRGRTLLRGYTLSTEPSSGSDEAEMSPATTSSNSDVIDVSKDAPIALKHQLHWESKEATFVVSNDQSPDFLTSSHIGPVITKLNTSPLSKVLQLGDVIIRLNGEDVSTLEAEVVSELLMKFEGRSIRVTYLRKTMLV